MHSPAIGTLLHELSHIVHNNHGPGFYKLLDELKAECEADMAAGVYSIMGAGRMLGPGKRVVPRDKAAAAAAKAAERRRLMPGRVVLGGDRSRMAGMTARQMVWT